MIVYSEEKIGHQSIFIKTILNNDGVKVRRRVVNIPLYQVKKDNFTYFILYDDDMNVISDVYEYLNFTLKENPITSRSKAAFSLRLLYCFLSLYKYDVKKIDSKILNELLFFLRGININPIEYGIKTQRSSNTINGYLSIYRNYFINSKIKCKPLFKSHTVTSTSNIGNDFTSVVERLRYDNNLKTSKVNIKFVPKYISPEDFKKLYKIAITNNDKTAKIIMHLMYGYGLRLGEVLGLTIEDVQEVYAHNKLIPVLFLRNRMSDRKFQFAKNLPHVIDKKQYASNDYKIAKTQIIITYDFYEELLEYIEEIHTKAMKKYEDNYNYGVADIVSTKDIPETNHYIFLNRYGKVLSDQTWNNSLKKYFNTANIPLDLDVRENNLSHRFRHGFAMFHARFSNHIVDILSLQKLMRHKNISSTMIYFNPTPDDEFKTKTEFQTELYTLIPELKEGFDE